MDLWIRSQDKSALVNVKSVLILNKEIRGYYNENPNWFLGKYETEERALEVLDEIQNKIANSYQFYTVNKQNYMDCTGDHVYKIPLQTPVIYEMPKE